MGERIISLDDYHCDMSNYSKHYVKIIHRKEDGELYCTCAYIYSTTKHYRSSTGKTTYGFNARIKYEQVMSLKEVKKEKLISDLLLIDAVNNNYSVHLEIIENDVSG